MVRVLFFLLIATFVTTVSATAADVKERFPLRSALQLHDVQQVTAGNVKFFWGDQVYPEVRTKYGTFKTSERELIRDRSRSDACALALAKALIRLKERAEIEGGNAVVNIVSNIKNREESSPTEYSCLVGRAMVNVALKGSVVSLAQ